MKGRAVLEACDGEARAAQVFHAYVERGPTVHPRGGGDRVTGLSM